MAPQRNKMNLFFLLLSTIKVVKCLLFSNEILLTNEKPKVDLSPVFVSNGSKFYEAEKIIHQRYPNTIELAKYVVQQKKITFNIDKKTINIFPLSHIESVKDGKVKILGYFDRISLDDSIILKYKNGEATVYGAKNSAMVKFSFSETPSFKQLPSSMPDKSLFDVKLNCPTSTCESKKIFIETDQPTVGKYLSKLTSCSKSRSQNSSSNLEDQNENSNSFLIQNGTLNLKMLKELSKKLTGNSDFKLTKIKYRQNLIDESQLKKMTQEMLDESQRIPIEEQEGYKVDEKNQNTKNEAESVKDDVSNRENKISQEPKEGQNTTNQIVSHHEDGEGSNSKKDDESADSKENHEEINTPTNESNLLSSENKEQREIQTSTEHAVDNNTDVDRGL